MKKEKERKGKKESKKKKKKKLEEGRKVERQITLDKLQNIGMAMLSLLKNNS